MFHQQQQRGGGGLQQETTFVGNHEYQIPNGGLNYEVPRGSYDEGGGSSGDYYDISTSPPIAVYSNPTAIPINNNPNSNNSNTYSHPQQYHPFHLTQQQHPYIVSKSGTFDLRGETADSFDIAPGMYAVPQSINRLNNQYEMPQDGLGGVGMGGVGVGGVGGVGGVVGVGGGERYNHARHGWDANYTTNTTTSPPKAPPRAFVPYGIPASRRLVLLLFVIVLFIALAALAIAVVALSKSSSSSSSSSSPSSPQVGASSSNLDIASMNDLHILNASLIAAISNTTLSFTTSLATQQTQLSALAGDLHTTNTTVALLTADLHNTNNTVTLLTSDLNNNMTVIASDLRTTKTTLTLLNASLWNTNNNVTVLTSDLRATNTNMTAIASDLWNTNNTVTVLSASVRNTSASTSILATQLSTASVSQNTQFQGVNNSMQALFGMFTTLNNSFSSTSLSQQQMSDSLNNSIAKVSSIASGANWTAQQTVTCAQIGSVYNGTACVPLSAATTNTLCFGLEGYYPFDNKATDMSMHGRDGTFVGTAAYQPGVIGQAASFNGASLVQVPAFANFNFRSAFSVSAWFNRASGYNTAMGIVNNGYSTNGGFEVHMGSATNATGSGRLLTAGINSGPHPVTVDFNNVYVLEDSWHHVTLTYDGNAGIMKMQVDGVQVPYSVHTVTDTGMVNIVPNAVVIGQSGAGATGEYFRGLIDDVRIYSRILTPTETLQLYNLRTSTVCPAPLPQYPLGSVARPAESCAAIMNAGAQVPGQSAYWISAGGTVFQVTCDMTNDGGGWTLILSVASGSMWGSVSWYKDMPMAQQAALFATSNAEFRFTANDGTSSELYIYDKAPFFLQGSGAGCGGMTHFWQSYNPSGVLCRNSVSAAWVSNLAAAMSCCTSSPYGIGVHTCGIATGWILFHQGSTFNAAGTHPCPATGTGSSYGNPPTGSLNNLWMR